MAKVHDIVCIVCPIGCRMKVTEQDNGEITVEGNTCKRGEKYGVEELTNPTRVVPTTVKIENGVLNRLPVKTNGAVPKGKIFEVMEEINKVNIKAPVKVGDVIIENVLDTGIDIVASRSMAVKSE